jgi:riboflavin kinase
MPKRKAKSSAERLTTLLHLVKLGAGASFQDIPTKKLGASIDLSQQAASLRLIELEKAGLVERAHSGRGLVVRLTDEGVKTVEVFLAQASTSLDRGKRILNFRGTLFTGLGEGAYYVSIKGYSRAFSKSLGFEPFPGTFNLRLTNEAMIGHRRHLNLARGIEVPGFRDDKRSYGPVKCFKAKIEGKYIGAVLAIERTHYDNSVLEVIAPANLRKVLGLRDGDGCSVTAYLEGS